MEWTIEGKTVLVTGSTDGLGKLVAKNLARQGATILLHGRNEEKGRAMLHELQKESPNKDNRYYNADFASLKEVDSLAQKILQENESIDVLINNVGIGRGADRKTRELSKDGIELRFVVNYLSHVLLTEKLLPIIPSDTSRIINVASIGQEPIDFKNVMLEKGYEGFLAYKQSKTALIMYTFDLAQRLKTKNIKVNALHPASLMNTKMVLDDWGSAMTTVEQGAAAVENLLYVNTSGEYYDGKHVSKAIAQAYDPGARAALEKLTRELLKEF